MRLDEASSVGVFYEKANRLQMTKIDNMNPERSKYNWIPDFVYGGIDGAVTTFAVVMGVVGAQLSTPIILILGVANLLADGFSMAVSKYSSDMAEKERIAHITAMEHKSIKENPEEEKQEVRDILKSFGFRGRDLVRAEKVITNDKEAWVHMMLHHEFHVVEENIRPYRGALTTFVAFVLIGSIPLVAYIFQGLAAWGDQMALTITVAGTLFALFIVGAVKAQFSERHWVLSGIETAAIGGAAALISYLVGDLLGELFSVS